MRCHYTLIKNTTKIQNTDSTNADKMQYNRNFLFFTSEILDSTALWYLPEGVVELGLHKHLYTNVHSGIIDNGQKLSTTQTPIN